MAEDPELFERAVEAAACADYEHVRATETPGEFELVTATGRRKLPPSLPWEELSLEAQERFKVAQRPAVRAAAAVLTPTEDEHDGHACGTIGLMRAQRELGERLTAEDVEREHQRSGWAPTDDSVMLRALNKALGFDHMPLSLTERRIAERLLGDLRSGRG